MLQLLSAKPSDLKDAKDGTIKNVFEGLSGSPQDAMEYTRQNLTDVVDASVEFSIHCPLAIVLHHFARVDSSISVGLDSAYHTVSMRLHVLLICIHALRLESPEPRTIHVETICSLLEKLQFNVPLTIHKMICKFDFIPNPTIIASLPNLDNLHLFVHRIHSGIWDKWLPPRTAVLSLDSDHAKFVAHLELYFSDNAAALAGLIYIDDGDYYYSTQYFEYLSAAKDYVYALATQLSSDPAQLILEVVAANAESLCKPTRLTPIVPHSSQSIVGYMCAYTASTLSEIRVDKELAAQTAFLSVLFPSEASIAMVDESVLATTNFDLLELAARVDYEFLPANCEQLATFLELIFTFNCVQIENGDDDSGAIRRSAERLLISNVVRVHSQAVIKAISKCAIAYENTILRIHEPAICMYEATLKRGVPFAASLRSEFCYEVAHVLDDAYRNLFHMCSKVFVGVCCTTNKGPRRFVRAVSPSSLVPFGDNVDPVLEFIAAFHERAVYDSVTDDPTFCVLGKTIEYAAHPGLDATSVPLCARLDAADEVLLVDRPFVSFSSAFVACIR